MWGEVSYKRKMYQEILLFNAKIPSENLLNDKIQEQSTQSMRNSIKDKTLKWNRKNNILTTYYMHCGSQSARCSRLFVARIHSRQINSNKMPFCISCQQLEKLFWIAHTSIIRIFVGAVVIVLNRSASFTQVSHIFFTFYEVQVPGEQQRKERKSNFESTTTSRLSNREKSETWVGNVTTDKSKS